MLIWLLIVLNIVICCWDSFASGMMWRHSRPGWGKIVAGSAFAVGVIGLLYTEILIAVVLGYLGPEWMIAQNVIIGIPLVTVAAVITADGWMMAIRHKRWWMFLICIWNSFALIWDIYVITRSLAQFGGAMKTIADSARKAPSKLGIIIILATAAIIAAVVSYVLFTSGMEHGEAMAKKIHMEKREVANG